MSPPGRPKGEYRSAQREGTPVTAAAEPLRADDHEPPEDRFCDLVLTGGVTSGVIYPAAIHALSRQYRFHAIGGTSAGAMAAALTAAAEYARRFGSSAGFEVLQEIPERLARPVGQGRGAKTKLRALFQPSPRCARLFEVLIDVIGADLRQTFDGLVGRSLKAIARVYGKQPAAIVTVVLLSSLLAIGLGLDTAVERASVALLAFVTGVGVVIAVVALRLGRDVRDGLVANDFGLCTGKSASDAPDEDSEAVIDWLHKGIQWACGRSTDEAALTFKDLWEAPPAGLPPATPRQAGRRAIDLRMVTTSLTHGRPCELPLADTAENECLFFCLDDWQRYFPPRVIAQLRATCTPYGALAGRFDQAPEPEGKVLLQMPRSRMPLLVAARLSLSFPVLFCAVPAWGFDPALRQFRPCWFSDGGICANFPIHLFDASIPSWPTFGVFLTENRDGAAHSVVEISRTHDEGAHDVWTDFGDPHAPPSLARLGRFAWSIVNTARRWHDYTLARMPGVRDRVVRVALGRNQGELNLKMAPDEIRRIVEECGVPAARQLIDKYAPHGPDGAISAAWSEHRWVRFNAIVDGLRERLDGLAAAAEAAPGSLKISQQIERASQHSPLRRGHADRLPRGPWQSAPPPMFEADDETGSGPDTAARMAAPLGQHRRDTGEDRLDDEQRQALAALLDALVEFEQKLQQSWHEQPYVPNPRPRLAVRPPM